MKINKELIPYILKFPFSKKARDKVYDCINHARYNKLVMTLLIKDEEILIERFVRFHFAMGIDFLIVMLHNTTDRSKEILEKLIEEGFPIEIIIKNTPEWKQEVFVHEMILKAINTYKATWIINSDGDEFYFSEDLNLKESLLNVPKAVNCVYVRSTFSFPCEEYKDFLQTPYFLTNCILPTDPLADQADKYPMFYRDSCNKTIHRAKGYIQVRPGNHTVKMKNRVRVPSDTITLFHFHVKNYEELEKKIKRWNEKVATHMVELYEHYHKGTLKQYYDNLYGNNAREMFLEHGHIGINRKFQNFMKAKNICNKYS